MFNLKKKVFWKDCGDEDIEIHLPEVQISSAKKVTVEFKSSHLCVRHCEDSLLDITLPQKILPDECNWAVCDKRLQITLAKRDGSTRWGALQHVPANTEVLISDNKN